jgi:hypothetical protein
MKLSDREIVAIAATRPKTYEGILRGFQFTDLDLLAIVDAMRIAGPSEDYRAWIDYVSETAKTLRPSTDWATWWRETIGIQATLLARIAEFQVTMR